MAITTYAELQTAVLSWLTRSGDTDLATYVPDFVTLCEAQVNRVLRVREMETSENLTVNAQSVALPTGYMQTRRLYLNTSPISFLEYVSPEVFWTDWSYSSDQPKVFSIEGDNLLFGPTPSSSYTGKILFWKRLDITASAHSLFTRHPDLYLYGSLVKAEPFIRNDERMPLWKAQFAEVLAEIKAADIKDRHSGGGLRAKSDAVGF